MTILLRPDSAQLVNVAGERSFQFWPGDRVESGDTLAELHVRRPDDALRVADRVRAAFRVAPEPPPPMPFVRGRVEVE